MAIVGAMGVGMTASTATAADAPAPLPIAPPTLEGSAEVLNLQHPASGTSKTAATPRAAKLAASAAPVDSFDGNITSDLVLTDRHGGFYLATDTAGLERFEGAVGNLVITPGDLSGDGHADMITRTANGELRLYTGIRPGNPSATSYKRIGTGWQIYNRVLGAGDLTGDGRPDLLARTPAGELYLYRGQAGGTLGARVKVGTGWQGFDQLNITRDLTGDNRPDVLARTPAGVLFLYKGQGNGTFGSRTQIGTGWNTYNQIIAGGDYDGDGVSEVLARAYNGDLYGYSANGKGGLGARVKLASGWNVMGQVANSGSAGVYGKSHLFVRNDNGIQYYAYNGKGGFSPRYVYSTEQWARELPIINSMSIGADEESDPMTVDGDRYLFSLEQGSRLAGWSNRTATVGPGDLTGDGYGDIVARNTAGQLHLYPGRSNGRIGAPILVGGGWNIYNSLVGAGDVSGDGRADLFARTPAGDLFLYKGLGNGKFAGRVKVGTSYNIYNKMAAPGDLNGDGLADLLGVDKAGKLWLHTGKFGGTLNKRVQIGTGWNMFTSLS